MKNSKIKNYVWKTRFLNFSTFSVTFGCSKLKKNEASIEYWLGFEKWNFGIFENMKKACQGASAKMNKE